MENALTEAIMAASQSLTDTCMGCEGYLQKKCPAAALVQKLGVIVESRISLEIPIMREALEMTQDYQRTVERFETFGQDVRACPGWSYGKKAFTAGRSMVLSGNGNAVLYLDFITERVARTANLIIGAEATETIVTLKASSNQRTGLPAAEPILGERDPGDAFANA